MSSSTVTYTSMYSDSEPWRFQWVSDDELKAPEEALQSSGQAPPSLDYVPGHEHPPSPDYVPGPKEPEQAPLSPDYDQPSPVDASPTTLSPGYVVDSDPVEDPEEDPEEDPADGGDDNDDDEDAEEEEHLAPTDSTTLRTIDPVSPDEDIEAFETDESAPTLPSPKSYGARISVQPQTPMSATVEALIVEIRLRVASPSTHHPSEIPSPPHLLPSTAHRDDIPKADMPLWKRAYFSAPASRFEVGESLVVAAARQAGRALTSSVNYGFIDTVDASIRASESRAMTVVGVVNERVTDLATTQRQETHEL
ncbi:hypothetical protein Tco_1273837 [Tanacetum coccineum]